MALLHVVEVRGLHLSPDAPQALDWLLGYHPIGSKFPHMVILLTVLVINSPKTVVAAVLLLTISLRVRSLFFLLVEALDPDTAR